MVRAPDVLFGKMCRRSALEMVGGLRGFGAAWRTMVVLTRWSLSVLTSRFFRCFPVGESSSAMSEARTFVKACSVELKSESVVVFTLISYVSPPPVEVEEEELVLSRDVTRTEDLEVIAASSPRVAGIAS